MSEPAQESIEQLQQTVAALEARVQILEEQRSGADTRVQPAAQVAWAHYEEQYRQWEQDVRLWHQPQPAAQNPPKQQLPSQFGGPPHATPSRPLAAARAPREPFTIEDLFSPRILAWTGGAVLVAGIAFLVSIGIQDGWITPAMQIFGALVACFVLIFAGFVLYEKEDQGTAAMATFSSGIAGLFATLVVMTQTYDYVDPLWLGPAFAGLIAAGGTAVAWRWDSEQMAALALLGALFSPVLIGALHEPSTVWFVLLGYAAVALLCTQREWQLVRIGAVFAAAPGVIGPLLEHSTPAVVVAGTVFWLLTIVAFFGGELLDPKLQRPSGAREIAGVIVGAVSLLTALLVALRIVEIQQELHPGVNVELVDSDAQLATWLIGFAVLHFLIAGASAARHKLLSNLEVVLGGCAVLLLVVGLSYALSGAALVAAWGALALALAAVAYNTEGSGLDWAPAPLVALCAAHAIGIGVTPDLLGEDPAAFSSALLWDGIGALSATIVAAASWAYVARDEARNMAVATAVIGAVYLAGFVLQGVVLVVALCVLAAVASELGRGRGAVFAVFAPGLPLVVAAVHVLIVEAPPSEALSTGIDDLAAAVIALLAVAGTAALWAQRTDRAELRLALGGLSAASLVYMVSAAIISSFQPTDDAIAVAGEAFGVRQQGQALLSGFWALTALAAIVYGLKTATKEIRYAGLGLLAVAVAKIVFFDLVTLDAAYRTGSFIAVGVMLLLAAFAYQNLKERVAQ